jgi:cytokinesis protein
VGLVSECDDFDMRVHYRSQMEAAGVRLLFDKFAEFESTAINRQLKNWESIGADDHRRLLELYDQEILKNVHDPEDVFKAIQEKVAGTKANDYFLSAMRHLLLIRGEDDEQSRYYQLVDSLVSSIVLDRNPNFAGGLSSITGVSVARLVAQMGDQDHARKIEDEAKALRARVVELELDREDMRQRLAQSADGLVGDLQARVRALEEKLRVSRHNTESLKGQIDEQRRGFNEQIEQLEVQITELFKMLRDARGFENLVGKAEGSVGGMARKDLVMSLSKQMERKKTIGILEGKHRKKGKKGINGNVAEEDGDTNDEDEDEDAEDADAATEVRLRKTSNRGRLKSGRHTGRVSQFADAEEDRVQEHAERSLAEGAELVVSQRISYSGCHCAHLSLLVSCTGR